MDITTPEGVVTPNVVENQETLDKSNVQKRIDELTAEKHSYARQVEQLTETVAQMLKRDNETRVAPVVQHVQDVIPEGLDPAIAKYLQAQAERTATEVKRNAEQMFWQMQNQLDQVQVANKYAHLPKEVIADAANRLTGLKQQYGQAANMDDAIALAHWQWSQKQGRAAQAQQYNQMNQPLAAQGSVQQPQSQSTNLASPASLPNWDNLDLATQNKLIDKWEQGGGRLL